MFGSECSYRTKEEIDPEILDYLTRNPKVTYGAPLKSVKMALSRQNVAKN
jgi:hypothetical protein